MKMPPLGGGTTHSWFMRMRSPRVAISRSRCPAALRALSCALFTRIRTGPSASDALSSEVLSLIGPNEWGLNLGAGSIRPHARVINMDLVSTPGINIVTDGALLPFQSNSLTVVIAQEVLEHIAEYEITINEVHRCLTEGGVFYCQVRSK